MPVGRWSISVATLHEPSCCWCRASQSRPCFTASSVTSGGSSRLRTLSPSPPPTPGRVLKIGLGPKPWTPGFCPSPIRPVPGAADQRADWRRGHDSGAAQRQHEPALPTCHRWLRRGRLIGNSTGLLTQACTSFVSGVRVTRERSEIATAWRGDSIARLQRDPQLLTIARWTYSANRTAILMLGSRSKRSKKGADQTRPRPFER